MKTIKCYLMDDEQEAITVIRSFVDKVPRLEAVGGETDPIRGLHELSQRKDVQLVFLDVQMEPLSGLEVMAQLPKDIQVILCTSYREFACDAFELKAVDYLLKPFSFNRFLQAVNSAEAALQYQPSVFAHDLEYHYFFVRTESKGKRILVNFSNINYIKADGEVTHIHLLSGGSVVVSRRIGRVYKRLPRQQFMRIHHSYIVNIARVVGINNGKVLLQGQNMDSDGLPIGSGRYARDLYSWIDDYLLD